MMDERQGRGEGGQGVAPGEGPLAGLRIIEFEGLGPTPFAAMLLADLGADVVRITRPNHRPLLPQRPDFLERGRGHVALDLKSATGRDAALALMDHADGLIEGHRPGVMERLGLGPEIALERNPRLVYGRMTGWGQSGPRARTAGHDINYIALTGMLHAIGPRGRPVPPLNLVGDFGGGALYLVVGMLAALLEAERTGQGQVIDAAIVDGVTHLGAMIHSLFASGLWRDAREANLLDGGAPFYTTYSCADDRFVAVGALEEKFYLTLVEGLGLSPAELPSRADPANWRIIRNRFATVFRTRSRDEWARHFEGTDACVTPVLTLAEACHDPHLAAREAFVEVDGVREPAPAPRLSVTPPRVRPEKGAEDLATVLARWQQG